MRRLAPHADRAAELLENMPIDSVLRFASDLAVEASPWLVLAIDSGATEDLGVHWTVLDDDLRVWPVRVFIATHLDERHAVFFTYLPGGKSLVDFMIQVLEDDQVSPGTRGETGRTRLLSRSEAGAPPASPASYESR